MTIEVLSGKNEGSFKSTANVDDGVPVIISKINCDHTGQCKPSNNNKSCNGKKKVYKFRTSQIFPFCINCSKHQESGYISNEFFREILQIQYPKNKDITKYDVYNMKRKLQKSNPYMRDIATFCEFQLIFSSSNLEIGIDHIPKSEEDLVEMPKEIWSDIINEKGYNETYFFHIY